MNSNKNGIYHLHAVRGDRIVHITQRSKGAFTLAVFGVLQTDVRFLLEWCTWINVNAPYAPQSIVRMPAVITLRTRAFSCRAKLNELFSVLVRT